MHTPDLALIVGGFVVAVGVTGVFLYRLVIRDPKPRKFRRWLGDIWDAISTILAA